MSEELEAAVVGAGIIGERHARLLDEHHRTNLRAVVDLDADRAEAVGERFGAAVVATDAEETLTEEPIDIVVVATPETAHLGPTEVALANDCHVLLEKPIAESVADARRIGEVAEAADAALMIAYCCRFDPEYAALKARIDAGEFGDVLGIQAARIGSVAAYEQVADWTHPAYYLAVHDVDAMLWYLDAEVERLTAYASGGLGDLDTPAIVSTTLTFENGAVGTLETNWARTIGHPLELTQEIRLTGTDGYSRLVVQDDRVPVSTPEGFEYAPTDELYGRVNDMYRFQLDHFLECVREDREPLVTWEDGLRSLRVANAIRDSLESGRPVSP